AGVAADEHHSTRHQTSAQHSVKLIYAGRPARLFSRINIRDLLQLAGFRDRLIARAACFLRDAFDQGIPGSAVRALALPLEGLPAAFGTAVDRFWLGHGSQTFSRTGTLAANAHINS